MRPDASTTPEYTVADQQRMSLATNYFSWQARLAKEQIGNRVIEIGCGLGNFTQHLLDREAVVSLDVVEECIDHLKRRYPNQHNLQTSCLDVQDPAFLSLRRHHPDTIVCLNVLEHVKDDHKALQHMHSVLESRGRAVFIVPAFESLYGPIDRNLGHFRRYSKLQWRELAESAGFKVKFARYINSIGLLAWWFNAKVLRREEQSEGQIAIFDTLIVPLLSILERLIEPPFGQSILTVLEKQ